MTRAPPEDHGRGVAEPRLGRSQDRTGAGGQHPLGELSDHDLVVLVHDRMVGGRFRRHDVRSMSAADLMEFDVPRLADVYESLGTDFEFSIDAKHDEVVDPMLDVAAQHGALERLWVCHGSISLLAHRRPTTTAKLVHSYPKDRLSVQVERHAYDLQAAGIDVMNFRHVEWTQGLVAMFHRFDLKAFAWDVQEVRHLRAMTAIGIDGLYCDRPERMVAAVSEFDATQIKGT